MSDAKAHSDVDAAAFKADLTDLIPHLRAFARSLCGDRSRADDLAQEALLRAWKSRDRFEPGTNLKAWAFTILRNLFYSQQRRAWRSQPLDQEVAEATLVATENPAGPLEVLELKNALLKLPDDQREALVLVGAGGLSYEETAVICGCAVGTVKSRVSRARKALVELLDGSSGGIGVGSGREGTATTAMDDIMEQAAELAGSTHH